MSWSGRRALSLDDLRKEARKFLGEYNEEETIPVPIEEIVEFDFELELIPVPGIKEDLQVDAFLTSNLTAIYIDEYVLQHVPNRFRFSLAHELAHYWLHEDLYTTNTIGSVRDYRKIQSLIGVEDYRWFEWQANTFAGLILVPEDALADSFAKAIRVASARGFTRKQLETFPARQHVIHGLSKAFEVSEDVMTIRLEKDGHLPPLAGRRRE